MRELTLAALLFLSLTAYGQPSEVHCIPIDDSRWLHEQALKVRNLDSVVNSQDREIHILETAARQEAEDYEKLLKGEQEKTQYHKEISSHMESLANSFRSERDYYIKRERKQRRKKNLLTYGGLVLLGIIAIK